MIKRQQFTYKFDSAYLRFRKWEVELDFRTAMASNMIVAVADTQAFKTVRDVTGASSITDAEEIEALYRARDELKSKRGHSKRVRELQDEIYGRLYLSEYITVVMDGDSDYEYLHINGFRLNGRRYKEFNSSASQARVRTVAFLAEDVFDEVMGRLNCGRRMDEPMVPAKFSAYLGLACSSISEVTWPRIAIVKDYTEFVETVVDYVVETPENTDDEIDRRMEMLEFNRFDGSGIVSPAMAEQWALDLGLDYVPAQFCIRCAFTKGMVTVFDWDAWIADNGSGSFVEDIYGNTVDLRKVDAILTESQVKLWNSWENTEAYVNACDMNGIVFGISLWSPKEDKSYLVLNYQFIQTLHMEDSDIEQLCQDTVNYLSGVSVDNLDYTKLFLLGERQNEDSTLAFLQMSDDYWLKSLMVEPLLFNDKYSKQRIRGTIIKRIEQAACGKIMVPGNFQVIVPDTVAFMEALFGFRVEGLLKPGEAYSNFWDEKGSTVVNTMRSPLTNYSEHYLLNMVSKNEDSERGYKIKKYFKYSYTGFIVNIHDDHSLRWAGSDYDYDIIASTDSPTLIRCTHEGLVPIIGKTLKGSKICFTDEDRYVANKLTFGSRIGRLTNLASAMCCLRAEFEEDSAEYNLINGRLKSCCKHQSNQIDKAKAGVEIKNIPKIWMRYNKILDTDTEEETEAKSLFNRCLVDKHPYFFKYIYQSEKIRYNKYMTAKDKVSRIRFNMPIKELLSRFNKNEALPKDQLEFISMFHNYNGFINAKSEMNRLCWYIEGVDFEIRKKISDKSGFDYSLLLNYDSFEFNKSVYDQVSGVIVKYIKARSTTVCDNYYNFSVDEINTKPDINSEKMVLKDDLFSVCSSLPALTNYMVRFFYEDKPSFSKSVLWDVCGKQIYKNLLKGKTAVSIPERDLDGDIMFMYKTYKLKEVEINHGEDL